METKPGDLSPNQEGAKKNNMRSSEDLASDSTKENIRKARIRYFHSTNTYRGFTDGKDGPNTMREDMDFMQPKGGFSAELSHSGKNSNPISLNQSRMNESGMLCCMQQYTSDTEGFFRKIQEPLLKKHHYETSFLQMQNTNQVLHQHL